MNKKTCMIIINIIFTLSVRAFAFELQVGDILLQPLHCWSCSLIEAQTNSEYSHIGIVVKKDKKTILVAESFQKVKLVSLKEFDAKTEKGKTLKVMRPFIVSPHLFSSFNQHFNGLPYDSKFLWESKYIYCSELVYKLLHLVNMNVPRPRPMLFDINRMYWERFFRGEVPASEIGISPADFDDEHLYEFIGNL